MSSASAKTSASTAFDTPLLASGDWKPMEIWHKYEMNLVIKNITTTERYCNIPIKRLKDDFKELIKKLETPPKSMEVPCNE